MGVTVDAVVWHDLECGAYTADLDLWRELAGAGPPPGRVLDVGAGTGRVALDLAARGHTVTAIDLDTQLLAALRERARDAGANVEAVHANARAFELARRDHALCLMPMQTIQLLPDRGRFFAAQVADCRAVGQFDVGCVASGEFAHRGE